ncbi:MAG TPA: DNA translocase FtsK [Thermoleophilaceae bacterium]|nr:DNA translocase FtsK [Thermoleophilaceae bacterium]
MGRRPSQRRPRRRPRRPPHRLPRLPPLEQRQLDVIGLALVALAAFLAFVFYLGWSGGELGGALAGGLVHLGGRAAYLAPVGIFAVGAVLVLRPMLPTTRPLKAGAVCLIAALVLGLAARSFGLGPDRPAREAFFDPAFFRSHGGALGEALFWVARLLLQEVGTDILVVFLFVTGLLLLTGATVAGVLRATGEGIGSTSRRVRRSTGELAGLVAGRAPRTEPRRRRPRREAAFEPSSGGPLAPDPVSPVVPGEGGDGLGQPAAEPIVRATHVEVPPGREEESPYGEVPEFPAPPEFGAGHGEREETGPASPDEPLEPEPTLAAEPPGADEEVTVATGPGRGERPGSPVPGPDDLTPQGRLRASITEADDFVYVPPRPSFLRRSKEGADLADTGEEARLGAALVEALSHFGVDASVTGTVSGPHVTRYELRLAPGTKMAKVAQLKDDIAYALAATDVRILAPIPGKTAVGVEVPNHTRRTVHLGDVYQEAPGGWSPLTVWLGKDIAGKAIGTDLAKQPHILVAGTTGSGKSGCVNAMLSSILLHASPHDVKLVLVDPKQVELNHYESIPHLITPVVINPRVAANVLANLIKEMEERYSIMSLARSRNLVELNRAREKRGERPLPYILCVIDELADLMMVAPADVEDAIIRLAQKSRAVGIHLVLATQRPSADIITGMIKANVPARIAFAVSSQTDSRVILDSNGAESLLGQGDMLFRPATESRPARIQGAFIAEDEIERLTDHWRRQGEPELHDELLEEVESEVTEAGDDVNPDADDLLGEAIATVAQLGSASTSMLQRRLRVGYTRAGRLIDMMERRGVISGYEGSKARQVLISEADVARVLAAVDEPVGAGSRSEG